MYEFALVYSVDFGIQQLGVSYVATAVMYMLFGYCFVAVMRFVSTKLKDQKITTTAIRCSKVEFSLEEAKKEIGFNTTKVTDPKILNAYNKKKNRYEKYLVWVTKNGKILSSSRITWIDNVDLVVVDDRKSVYECTKKPKKISASEYFELKYQQERSV